jgi:ABC-type Fe3+-hydroxamate transport system substrate-binding protein
MPSHLASRAKSPVSATVIDGLNRPVHLPSPPRSIVSLVPSLTEALFAMGLSERIAGRTKYCVQPADQVGMAPVVGGTKNPDVGSIISLEPALVIASAEENVREHIEALIAANLTVYVSLPSTVRRAIAELHDIAVLTNRISQAEPWLTEATTVVQRLERRTSHRKPLRYFCPIWRRPYMVAAPDTYMSDLLRLCGGENIFTSGPARYYAVELDEVARRAPDVILLPSEPYPFSAKHVPEIMTWNQIPAVQTRSVHLIDGQWITWYGPRIAPSLRAIAALFESV